MELNLNDIFTTAAGAVTTIYNNKNELQKLKLQHKIAIENARIEQLRASPLPVATTQLPIPGNKNMLLVIGAAALLLVVLMMRR